MNKQAFEINKSELNFLYTLVATPSDNIRGYRITDFVPPGRAP